jgi:hypothetical protein
MSERTFRDCYERWFQGWLVLAPIVGLGSITLVKNQLYRVWKVKNGLTDGVSAQQAREMGLTPPDWTGAVWFGVATAAVFTVFYMLAARTWTHQTATEDDRDSRS